MFEEVSLYRLKVFCAVVNTKSFRVAAEQLHISQPAISAHIRALENETRTTLLERGRVCKTTEAGRFLYNFANDTLKKACELTHIIDELRSGNMGRIAMGSSGTLARYVVPDILSKFKEENPLVEIALHIGTRHRICKMTLDWEIDFGFVIGKSDLPGLDTKTVAKAELVIVAKANHFLSEKELITPQELSEYPFVTALKRSSHYKMLEKILSANNIAVQNIAVQLEDAESIKKVVNSGLGVAVLLKACVTEELKQGKFKIINTTSGPMNIDLQIVSRPDKSVSPIQTKFLKFFYSRLNEWFAGKCLTGS